MKIQRDRYIILRNNRSEILCGLSRQFHFKKIDEIANAAIKTYNSYKKAESALNCWNLHWTKGCEIIPVVETIEEWLKGDFTTKNSQKDYPDDMDKECMPLCDLFNSIGLITQFSCCGHGESPFQIIFDDNVTDKQIYDFIDMLSQGKDHTPLVGSFLKWTRKVDGKISSNWTYQVDKIEWADSDLETTQRRVGDTK